MKKVEDFSDNLKDVFHYPKENENRYERRTAAAMDTDGNIWGCISFEDNGIRGILLQAIDTKCNIIYNKIIRDCNMPSAPFLFARADGGIAAVWIEWKDNTWIVVYAEKDRTDEDFSIAPLHRSGNACLHPALCDHGGNPFVVWSEYDEGRNQFSIFSSQYEQSNWSHPVRQSSGIGHCFRPSVCSSQTNLFIAWDEGFDGIQRIVVKEIIDGESAERNFTIQRDGERLIRPTLLIRDATSTSSTEPSSGSSYASSSTTFSAPAATNASACSLACISIQDVMDSRLGISDHSSGVVFARISDGILSVHPSRVAELDEGLLGKTVYVPYFGIRRKCHLKNDPDGGLWLIWEMRFEKMREEVSVLEKNNRSDEHYGYLIGKKFDKYGVWHDPVILHHGGTCYSLAGKHREGLIGIVYLEQSDVFKLPVLTPEWIRAEKSAILNVDKNGLERWDLPQPRIVKSERYQMKADGKTLGLFWSDTHVHSNFSPDAEGEPDELILYGRDIAGLDAMAMVDNDYYPHAGLMTMEWETQQALAKAYTQPGRFVVFPGYEFTYHDRNLKPNFNHRYVIYPQKGTYLARLDPRSRDLESLAKELSASDAVLVAHHPSWKLDQSPLDKFVEICSSWRISMEEKDFIKDHLMGGQQFAFIGSSDTHRACPGLGGALTGIFAEKLEPDSLFDAYKKRRTIVTQGLRIAIDFHVNELFIGDYSHIDKNPLIRLKVVSPVDLDFVEIIRDGTVLRRLENPEKTCQVEFEDVGLPSGNHFYYVRVKAVGDPSYNEADSNRKEYSGPFVRQGRYPFNFARAQGPFAWSTPVWVELQ